MALDEIFSSFEEGIAGFSGGPVNAPLGHVCAYAVVAMKALLENKGDMDSAADAIAKDRSSNSLDPEMAMIAINTVARKATELRNGPVTDTLITATEPTRCKALYDRAVRTYEELNAGKDLEEIVSTLDQERQANVESNAGAMFSAALSKDVKVQVTKLCGAARRSGKIVERYWAFDAMADVEVTVDGQTAKLPGFVHDLLPKIVRGESEDVAWAAPLAAAVMSELYLASNTIINVTVPAAVAAAMGKMPPDEAARVAERGCFLTVGIPGARERAENVAKLAARIVKTE
jgi:hypothetical protein